MRQPFAGGCLPSSKPYHVSRSTKTTGAAPIPASDVIAAKATPQGAIPESAKHLSGILIWAARAIAGGSKAGMTFLILNQVQVNRSGCGTDTSCAGRITGDSARWAKSSQLYVYRIRPVQIRPCQTTKSPPAQVPRKLLFQSNWSRRQL